MSENISAYVIGLQSWPGIITIQNREICIYSDSPSFIFKKDLFLSPKYPSIYLSKESCFSGSFPLAALVGDLSEHLCLAANLFSWQHLRDTLWEELEDVLGITKKSFFENTANHLPLSSDYSTKRNSFMDISPCVSLFRVCKPFLCKIKGPFGWDGGLEMLPLHIKDPSLIPRVGGL